jgi:hypothetical protein
MDTYCQHKRLDVLNTSKKGAVIISRLSEEFWI